MPVFSWEVLEVYAGPPVVVFKWRHWGQMTGKYSTKLDNPARKVTAEAHNGPINVVGMTIAHLSPEFKIEKLETFYDPAAIFEQLAKKNLKTEELPSETGTQSFERNDQVMGSCPFRPVV
jgi:hypothetical protein